MRYTPCFADPANLITPEEPSAPDAETALELLQTVYRDQRVPLPVRMRAAALAIPFETPKLGSMAISSMSENDFAAALDRAIERSSKLINGRAEQVE
jgi:hypothetical protein